MGSLCLTILMFRIIFVFLLPVSLLGLSVVPPRTALHPLLPHGTPYSPQYQPLFPAIHLRLICSSCSCSDDFWCASYCPECSTEEYCSNCDCVSSLGCRANCDKCSGVANSPASPPNYMCNASGGPAHGDPCIFPFIYQGVKYYGCAPLYGGLANTRGVANVYSPVYWCSTKVDVNKFHIRGPYTEPGKYVGYCYDTCPRAFFF